MSGSRHFTVVDDWVILNQEITSTEFRIYAILRAAVVNEYGGIPKSGIQVTAAWVSKISGELFSRSTAHRALRGLADKGVLGRLSEPQAGGDGVEYEFVVYPDADYKGVTNIQAEVARMKKGATRSIRFDTVEISGNPRNGLTRKDHVEPSATDILGQPVESEPEDSDPEFDTSGLGGSRPTGELTDIQQEFASELEEATGKNREPRLRLLAGQCEKIAQEAGAALERGWPPEVLARRLASELNPKIHSPQQFLIRKLGEVGKAPSKRPLSTLDRTVQQADRVTIDQLEDPEAIARVEAVKARYQENFRARQMTGRKS